MKKDFLDSVNVKSPCRESWEEMKGDDRVRFCSHCARSVHDLSAMTRAEAERLVKSSNGRLCVRYVKTPHGKLVSAPPKLTRITRQARVAAGVFAASLALSALAYAQQTSPSKPKASWTQTVKKLSETGAAKKEFSTISGTVMDSNEAVIVGAKVTLRGVNYQTIRSAATNEDGVYEFTKVEPDVYEIEIESMGFKKMIATDIIVALNERIEQAAMLEVEDAAMGIVVIADEAIEPPEPENPNQIVQSDKIRELPRDAKLSETLQLIPSASAEEKPKEEKSDKTKKKKN